MSTSIVRVLKSNVICDMCIIRGRRNIGGSGVIRTTGSTTGIRVGRGAIGMRGSSFFRVNRGCLEG